MQETLLSLQKKDEDMVVLDISSTSALVQSALFDDEEPEAIEVEAPVTSTSMSVQVRVAHFVFLVNAIYCAMFAIWSFVAYFLLREDVPTPTLIWILLGVSVLTIACYVAMGLLQRIQYLIMWQFSLVIWVTVLSAFLHNLSAVQSSIIVCLESLSLVAYCHVARKQLDITWIMIIMGVVGLMVWLAGIYFFILFNDWIAAGIIFVLFVVGFPLYAGYILRDLRRFNVSTTDRIRATVALYRDIAFDPVTWIRSRWSTTYPDL